MSLRNSLYHIIAQDENAFTIRFDASHPIFAGHFPGHPIVPGACLIQIAEELASLQAGRTVHFSAIRNLKFRQPVTPDQEVTIHIQNGKIDIPSYMCACADVQ
jgi:3-hydroxyacyl-[acyl-carrier-protein] dehydratase